MQILKTKGWNEYELLDSGNGQRLERFGKYILSKPDPQAIWDRKLSHDQWGKADAVYEEKGWRKTSAFPEKWELKYKDISFFARLTSFKHAGVFPEQHLHWDFIHESLSGRKDANILNLFGYTGVATLIAASAGAMVTHVDASRPAVAWARENQDISKLNERPVRWIIDDALEYVEREVRRGKKYDGILMDPPVYGHGPTGKIWNFEKSFPDLIRECSKLLSSDPLFVIANAYAISSSAYMLENVMRDHLKGGSFETGELVLEESKYARPLSTGIYSRWIPR